jgi:spermidine dehydrogenase
MKSKEDALGLKSNITRRDFLNAALIGTGAALMTSSTSANAADTHYGPLPVKKDAWSGYGAVGDYANASGNTQKVMEAGHRMRDGAYENPNLPAIDTGELYDMVIVGGGLSGLAAAHFFKKNASSGQKCLILENHSIFGGVAKCNEFMVNGKRLMGPQGSNDFGVLAKGGNSIPAKLYDELNIPREFSYQTYDAALKPLAFGLDNYAQMTGVAESLVDIGYYFNKGQGVASPQWFNNIWRDDLKDAPFSDQVKKDLLTWRYYNYTGKTDETFLRMLDSMTYKDYIEKVLKLSPEVTKYTEPVVGLINGASPDAVSAFAARQIGMPGMSRSRGKNESLSLSFPGGNTTFARYLIKDLIPGAIRGSQSFEHISNQTVNFKALDADGQPIRMRLNATVVRVEHDGDPAKADHVKITYEKDGKVYRLRAKSVVMASSGAINRHIIRDLPAAHKEAYSHFDHAPALVANIALTNWRFMYKRGITAAQWFDGFGFSCNIRKQMVIGNNPAPLHPDQPAVLTFYTGVYTPCQPLKQQVNDARAKILGTTFFDYEKQIRQQMLEQFGRDGFNPAKDIAGIILNRWGHARVVQPPGFYYGLNGQPSPREVIMQKYGRIAIGHSELNGHQSWTGAVTQGYRAAGEAFASI